MSLYEQFFSDINKDFMFNMANNVLKKDHNIIIEGDEGVKEAYLQDMKDIFDLQIYFLHLQGLYLFVHNL